jgi:TPR repeat protein
MNNVAVNYVSGDGVEKDIEMALYLFERSVEMNNPFAMSNLAINYKNGIEGILEINMGKSTKLFERASDLYHCNSTYRLGNYYQFTNINIEKAIKYYERSIELGIGGALYRLIRIYKKGEIGVEIDMKKVFGLYEKGFKMNDKSCTFKLYKFYSKGKHTQVDPDKAAFYLNECYKFFSPKYIGKEFKKLFSENKVEWRKEYHENWLDIEILNPQIITLLLVSKNRKECVFKGSHNLVKGIVMEIVKFLCNFQHTSCLNNKKEEKIEKDNTDTDSDEESQEL